MENKTTLKEMAKILEVSVSTVSRALNDSHEISTKTKKRIKELARLYNYTPNELAKSLKSSKTKTIGIIIPDILSHFFAESLHAIETTASKQGYKIIVCISNESTQKEAESINTFINGSVDGIIASLARETQANGNVDHFAKAINFGIPIVLFDRISDALSCDKISINDAEIAETATKELLNAGCRNIIYLSTIYDTSVDKQRQKGYSEEITKNMLPERIVHIKDYATFQEQLLHILNNSKVDGILAADELSAVSAMKIALKNGFQIPEDISVIGFTNGIMGGNFVPSLTTVDQFSEQQGSSAVETIIGRLEKTFSTNPIDKIIKTSIIHRDSTKKSRI